MNRLISTLCVLALSTPLVAQANNDLSTSYRTGSISVPSVDETGANDASTVGVNQGRASYLLPLVLPPGHPELTPSLGLRYHGSKLEGVLGAGWSLTYPSVRVRTSGRGGQPRWGTSARYLGLSGEELVELPDTLGDVDSDGTDEALYREERDTSFARYVQLSAGGWQVQYPDGRVLTLGTTSDARVVRSGYSSYIVEWLPESLEDRVGNQATWEWVDAATLASGLGATAYNNVARYLQGMRWGCQSCSGATTYQSLTIGYRMLTRPVTDFGPGFLVETELGVQTLDTATVVRGSATPVRTYTLGFDEAETRRLLTSVDVVAADGTSMPTIAIGYTDRAAPGSTSSALTHRPGASGFSSGVQPLDVDLDGRMDIVDLSNVGSGGHYYRHAGLTAAEFDSSPTTITDLPGASLAAGGTVSAEDGTRDIAVDVFDLGSGRLYAHNGAAGWDPGGVAATLPAITTTGDTVRIDVNADGYVDLLDTSVSPWVAYLDDGSRTYTADTVAFGASTTPTFGSVLAASDAGVLFGDLNGDGLVDVVYLDAGGAAAYAYYGRGLGGFGWLSEDGRGVQYSTLTITSSVGSPSRDETVLRDIDGDGFGDLISFDSSGGRLRVWQRIPGGGFADTTMGSPFTQTISSAQGCRIADWDIDGVSEILCSDGWTLYDWADQTPFLLETVDNGLGLVTRLTYTTTARVAAAHEAAGEPWSSNVAMAMAVVETSESDDSRGNVGVTSYDYRDASYEADELEDRFEFVGFGYVATETVAVVETTPGDASTRIEDPQDPGSLTRTFFDVGDSDFFLRGTVACTETWDRGATPASFECDVSEDGAVIRSVNSYVTSEADGITTVQLEATDEYVIEGGAAADAAWLRSEFGYDGYGNRTSELRFGQYSGSDDATGDDEQMVVTDYVLNTEDWILRLPRLVQRGGVDFTGAPSIDPLEMTCFVYDGVSKLCAPGYAGERDDRVSVGLRTQTQRYLDADLSDGAVGAMVTVERVTYTSRGLPDRVIDADAVVRDHDWDLDFGLFRVRETLDRSGLNLVTLYEVDPSHGETTGIMNPDGTWTAATYDGLGRMTGLLRAGDTLGSPSLSRSYATGAPTSTITDVRKDGLGGLITIHQLDGAGRTLCRRKEAPGPRWDIEVQREYTATGRVALAYLPAVAAGCDTMTVDVSGRSTSRNHDATVYDAIGRALEVTHQPSGATTARVYGVLTVEVSDEEDTDASSAHYGTPSSRTTDGQGRVVSVSESVDSDGDDAPEVYDSTYAYEPRGHLESVTDLLGATIYQARYDSRGLRVWSEDADRGTETVTYDDLGRVSQTVDARGHSLTFAYDAAGRVQTIAADDGTATETITHHYDLHPGGGAASRGCRTRGRLAWVEDPSGQTVFCYDAWGRTIQEDTTVAAYGATALVTSRTFDSVGRVQTLTHPDGTVLTYGYDLGGRANSLTVTSGAASYDIVTDARYGAAGQLERLDYGNGVQVQIGHDDRLRAESHTATLGGSTLYALELELDAVGNVASITDSVGYRSASFSYDDWYRLTLAEGDAFAGESLAYAHDLRGNLTARSHSDPTSDLHIDAFHYDPTAVHQLASVDRDGDGVDDETFTYDALGNLATDGTNAFAFDPAGLLREVSGVVDYTYDFLQRRVATEYASGDAVYFVRPADAELRRIGGVTTVRKHVSFAGRQVAIVQGTFTSADVEDHVFLLGFDHLGSPLQVWDVAASPTVVERWAGHPFGADNEAPFDAAGTSADYRAPGDATSLLSRRFQGREIDGQMPEHYDFGARVYRTDLGRFLSADAIVPDIMASQSWNRYAFVRNNPLSFVDPTGHQEEAPVGSTITIEVGDSVEGGPAPTAAPGSPGTLTESGAWTRSFGNGTTLSLSPGASSVDFGRTKITGNLADGNLALTLGDGTATPVTLNIRGDVAGSIGGVNLAAYSAPGLMSYGAEAAWAFHAGEAANLGLVGTFHGAMASGGAIATGAQLGGAATLVAAPYVAIVCIAEADMKYRTRQFQAFQDAMDFQLETTGSLDGWGAVADQMLHGPGSAAAGAASINDVRDIQSTVPAGSHVIVPGIR